MFLEHQSTDQIRFKQGGAAAVIKFASSGHFPIRSQYLITFKKTAEKDIVVYKNGTLLDQNESTGLPVADGAGDFDTIGFRNDNDRALDAKLYEFALYSAELGDSDRQAVETYLMNKFSL